MSKCVIYIQQTVLQSVKVPRSTPRSLVALVVRERPAVLGSRSRGRGGYWARESDTKHGGEDNGKDLELHVGGWKGRLVTW
jgi:hypothetical protein